MPLVVKGDFSLNGIFFNWPYLHVMLIKIHLLLSLSLLKCACSHAPISFRICGKKGKVLKRENVHQSGKDVLTPNDVSLSEPPVRAQFWSQVAGPPADPPGFRDALQRLPVLSHWHGLWSPSLKTPDTHSGWPNAVCLLLLNCITVAPRTVTARLLSSVLTVSRDFSSAKTRPRCPQLLIHGSGSNKLTASTWSSRWGRRQRSADLF